MQKAEITCTDVSENSAGDEPRQPYSSHCDIFNITGRLCRTIGGPLPSFVVFKCWVSSVNLPLWQCLKGCGWLLCKLAHWHPFSCGMQCCSYTVVGKWGRTDRCIELYLEKVWELQGLLLQKWLNIHTAISVSGFMAVKSIPWYLQLIEFQALIEVLPTPSLIHLCLYSEVSVPPRSSQWGRRKNFQLKEGVRCCTVPLA